MTTEPAAPDDPMAVAIEADRERIAKAIEAACTYGDRSGTTVKPCRTCKNAARLARTGGNT